MRAKLASYVMGAFPGEYGNIVAKEYPALDVKNIKCLP